MELRKRPTMQASLRVCLLFYPCSRTNVSQVLNHNGTARRSRLDKLLAQHMVMVSPLAQQFPTQLFEVSLSREGAFCLKSTTQAKDTTFLLFPSTFTQEMLVGSKSTSYILTFFKHQERRGKECCGTWQFLPGIYARGFLATFL